MKRSRTGIVRDERYLDHFPGPGHVESPERLEAIYALLDRNFDAPVERIEARFATPEEIAAVHAPEYVSFLAGTAARPFTALDPDTSASSRSYETALLAAGGAMAAADAVMDGRVRNAFALVRPPGHHAERGRAMGFCLFNNIAVAAEHLLRRRGLRRVLIADWDAHHGNGTQHAFYERRDVLYFSTHRYPFYPGTGSWREAGAGDGEGFTVNVPLGPERGDEDYRFIYRNILGPVSRAYAPDFILVSAGFDIFRLDPLGGMSVSVEGFAALTDELMAIAEESCGGKLLLVLEGGYDLDGQARSVGEVIRRLAGIRPAPDIPARASPALERELAPVFEVQGDYWPLQAASRK
jgi:acetoin utilization deacetylase AcuC-like enzyme